MTGIFIRILNKTTGKYENKELEHLTQKERREYFKEIDFEVTMRYIDVLCENLEYIDASGLLNTIPKEDNYEQKQNYK